MDADPGQEPDRDGGEDEEPVKSPPSDVVDPEHERDDLGGA